MSDQTYDPSITDQIATDETERLISSAKVEGTAVYDPQGERLGRIESFMVDKLTGQVAYAVLSFGGFLGIGEHHYPIPWSKLRYDKDRGGYVVDMTKDELHSAPSYHESDTPLFDRAYGQQVFSYWGVPYPYF